MIDLDKLSQYNPDLAEELFKELTGALEEIGLCRYILVQSSWNSHNGVSGKHLYYFFPKELSTFNLACLVETTLVKRGLSVRPGQIEIFPNTKSYKNKGFGFANYNAHRLPLQPHSGSYILNPHDYTFLSEKVADFVAYAQNSAENQDMELLEEQLKTARLEWNKTCKPRRKNNLSQWEKDLRAILERGWDGFGQTNEILRHIVNLGIVFEGLKGRALVDWMVEIATNLPGYNQFCRHTHEIYRRCNDWACSGENYWWRYKSDPNRNTTYDNMYDEAGTKGTEPPSSPKPPKTDVNEERQNDAIERIKKAVDYIISVWGKLPEKIMERIKTIMRVSRNLFGVGIGINTLRKYSSLWKENNYQSQCGEVIQEDETQSDTGDTDNEPENNTTWKKDDSSSIVIHSPESTINEGYGDCSYPSENRQCNIYNSGETDSITDKDFEDRSNPPLNEVYVVATPAIPPTLSLTPTTGEQSLTNSQTLTNSQIPLQTTQSSQEPNPIQTTTLILNSSSEPNTKDLLTNTNEPESKDLSIQEEVKTSFVDFHYTDTYIGPLLANVDNLTAQNPKEQLIDSDESSEPIESRVIAEQKGEELAENLQNTQENEVIVEKLPENECVVEKEPLSELTQSPSSQKAPEISPESFLELEEGKISSTPSEMASSSNKPQQEEEIIEPSSFEPSQEDLEDLAEMLDSCSIVEELNLLRRTYDPEYLKKATKLLSPSKRSLIKSWVLEGNQVKSTDLEGEVVEEDSDNTPPPLPYLNPSELADYRKYVERLKSLGVSLDNKLGKVINAYSNKVVQNAIDALVQSQTQGSVQNPRAFLITAIQNQWKPRQESTQNQQSTQNQKSLEAIYNGKTKTPPEFLRFLEEAIALNFVQDRPIQYMPTNHTGDPMVSINETLMGWPTQGWYQCVWTQALEFFNQFKKNLNEG